MRSLQEYREIYKEIARNNNITGDSVELLVQLLANASYISEVENISYTQEASLERSTLINSKIQHCMDRMYSVFRGRCPRVILNFKPTKYLEFNVYDKIVSSNDFNVYYLGYYSEDTDVKSINGTNSLPLEDGFIYGPCKISPALDDEDTVTVIGLIAKEKIEKTWDTDKYSTYYVDSLEDNLSSDMWVKISDINVKEQMQFYDTTRIFSDHILNHSIFDLTTTSFGSRLYIADIFMEDTITRNDEPSSDNSGTNISILATYYKFSRISEYKPSELKKINISGTTMTEFSSDFLNPRGYENKEIAPGVIIIPEVDREDIDTIHYKANKDRYVGSIIRSNSDVGTVLEEMYPEKVMPYGTNYIFTSGDNNNSGSVVDLYYVPVNDLNLLTDSEISEFINTKKAYYIVDDIFVTSGDQVTAIINIDLELYKPYTIDSEVTEILKTYEKKFNVDLSGSLDEIRTLLSKISNVKQVIGIDITYHDFSGNLMNLDELYDKNSKILPNIYFKIEYNINSIIQTKS